MRSALAITIAFLLLLGIAVTRAPAQCTAVGPGCQAFQVNQPSCVGDPKVGNANFKLSPVAVPLSTTAAIFVGKPAGPIGLPSPPICADFKCHLFMAPIYFISYGPFPLALPIPPTPALIGLQLAAQAIYVVPGNPTCLFLSSSTVITIKP
jgi:hypothetical protein